MSAADIDACEELFCGTWTLSQFNDVDEFMNASEMPENEQRFNRKLEGFTCDRIGNEFHVKLLVRGKEYDLPNITMGEELEWNPNAMINNKLLVTFENGKVWRVEITPLNNDGGKKYLWEFTRNGNLIETELSIPDVPGVTATQTFRKGY